MTENERALRDALNDLIDIALEGWKYSSPLTDPLTALRERVSQIGADDERTANAPEPEGE